jgi:hypothetical protein
MAQAKCLPSAMRALITGANQKSSTPQNVPSQRDLHGSYAGQSIVVASRMAGRLA